MRDERKIQKRIFRDPDFIMLNINAFLVILGYGIAVITHLESVTMMKVLKSFFLAISILILFRNFNLGKKPIPSPTIIYIFIFSFWVFLMSFFSENVTFAISRALTFLLPFLYVYLALHSLLIRYDKIELLHAFIKSTNLIYAFPVLTFIISGAGFGQLDIYGQGAKEGLFFVSNQYGWACAVFITTSVDILLNEKLRRGYLLFLLLFNCLALYLLLISGNRASWLSILLGLLVFIIRLKNVRTDIKIILAALPVAAIVWFYSIPESALQTRLTDTERQLNTGESRFNTAELAIHKFNNNKILWVTGGGMFNYEEIIHGEGLGDFHNSYLEVLFGGGIVLFLMFLNFMLFRPVYNYIRYYSRYFILIPPFVIITFFESNLTGGQFLFFPWFIFMLLLNIPPYYDNLHVAKSPGKKSDIASAFDSTG